MAAGFDPDDKQSSRPDSLTTRPPPPVTNTPRNTPLQCYKCGDLFNPDTLCHDSNTEIETCEEGEACLLYQWQKSPTERANVRHCFSRQILLGKTNMSSGERCKEYFDAASDSIQQRVYRGPS